MKPPEQMGLIGAGSVRQSFLARLPSLRAQLGPIKGVSYAAARRLVVALCSGFAVPNYAALEFCPVIWIQVPENELDHVVRDLAAQTPIHKTAVVICGSERESGSFDSLRARGARIATLNALDDSRSPSFFAEGQREALREIRKVLDKDHRKLTELRAGGKPHFLAGMHLMSELLRPLVVSAVTRLNESGLSRPEAIEMALASAAKSIRTHARSGAKPWSGPEARRLKTALQQRVLQVRETSELDAALYAQALLLALEYFERDSRGEKAVSHHA